MAQFIPVLSLVGWLVLGGSCKSTTQYRDFTVVETPVSGSENQGSPSMAKVPSLEQRSANIRNSIVMLAALLTPAAEAASERGKFFQLLSTVDEAQITRFLLSDDVQEISRQVAQDLSLCHSPTSTIPLALIESSPPQSQSSTHKDKGQQEDAGESLIERYNRLYKFGIGFSISMIGFAIWEGVQLNKSIAQADSGAGKAGAAKSALPLGRRSIIRGIVIAGYATAGLLQLQDLDVNGSVEGELFFAAQLIGSLTGILDGISSLHDLQEDIRVERRALQSPVKADLSAAEGTAPQLPSKQILDRKSHEWGSKKTITDPGNQRVTIDDKTALKRTAIPVLSIISGIAGISTLAHDQLQLSNEPVPRAQLLQQTLKEIACAVHPAH